MDQDAPRWKAALHLHAWFSFRFNHGCRDGAMAWIKAVTLEITIEAIVAFVIGGILAAASARADWNTFESIYPDTATI
jgi:hypothetical protein